MVLKQHRPIFWCVFIVTSFGFVCNLLSLILPFWYTRFPNSKNRFIQLGLWEVCFDRFMTDDVGNLMYDGCFYLYDVKISLVWRLIFRGWFVVCQAFHTMSSIGYILLEGIIFSQAIKLISPRGPRAVLSSMIISSLICVFLLITLITMGAGVDSESKMKQAIQQDWLADLDQNTLSWCYGLAALSLPGSLVPLILLGWFVYPKRPPGGLLIVSAWDWPTKADCVCRYQQEAVERYPSLTKAGSGPTPHSMVSALPMTGQSQAWSLPPSAHSAVSSSSHKAPTIRPATKRHNGKTNQSEAGTHSSTSRTVGGVSSYDPRSVDTVSLISQPPPSPQLEHRPLIEYSSSAKLSSTKLTRLLPAQEEVIDQFRQSTPGHLSAVSAAPDGHHDPTNFQTGGAISLASVPDTSVWLSEQPDDSVIVLHQRTIDPLQPLQAARPMTRGGGKRNRNKTKIEHGSRSLTSGSTDHPSTSKDSTQLQSLNNEVSKPTVLSAKPMRRKH